MHHARLLALALLAAVGPNCDGGSSAAKVLLTDDFTGTWSVVGAGTVATDNGSGTPAPSMALTWVGPSIAAVIGPTFNSTKGFTITVDLQHDSGASGALYLTHTGNNTIYTAVNILNGSAGYVSDPTGASTSNDNLLFAADANFHEFVIKFKHDGTVTWERDGVLHHTRSGFPDANYQLTYIVGAGIIRIDSLRVTQP